MSKTFTKPFARSDFHLHSTSEESGCAALVTAVGLTDLDVPDFLVLIYPPWGRGGERGRRTRGSCLRGRQTQLTLITQRDGSDEAAAGPRPPGLLLSSNC